MSGLVLRLAGPMQSWGEHSAFGHRDTQPHPTRSGLIGLLAAARGIPRGGDLGDYDTVSFTVRIDRPGDRHVDYHTVGGGLPPKRTVPTAEGKRRGKNQTTVQTWRSYLAGAVFTVAVTGPDTVIDTTAAALQRPHWQPYLGRRAFVPDQPMLLRHGLTDAVAELKHRVPLPPARRERDEIDFVHEADAVQDPGAGTERTRAVLNDVPVPAGPAGGVERSFTFREVLITPEPVPDNLLNRRAGIYREQLMGYMKGETR
ncbi:type I-E CRISPR-associated protein Cas5/CasD [Streptomonospora salina]|uniref:CRISPR system Cascade subunit CasD n=1 Tax=Streptomonospora salina TaxID=104205 RepID=A0A841EGT9_9ACTN|nr:type I-E CRISPR-associated protein Cas5/CasD [Streptomonospora salina]MBB6000058.1 CRISPR system Cascade subunit CasD [Streptomonospora salina]